MQDQTTARIATDSIDDHRHPFWCTERDEAKPADHYQHRSGKIYAELQGHDAVAHLSLAQLDDRLEGYGDARDIGDLQIRLVIKSRAMTDWAEAYMTVREAETVREALDFRISEARNKLQADREHSRGWALGAGDR